MNQKTSNLNKWKKVKLNFILIELTNQKKNVSITLHCTLFLFLKVDATKVQKIGCTM